MAKIELELLGEVPLYLGVGIQIIAAVFLGGLVGFDREKKMKAAGLKTNILICLGATLYTTMSILHLSKFSQGPIDPNRVGAQIVSGIGFLGAGAIIQGGGAVIGMTTAASIWVVAAIGYTIGTGYPLSAALFSLTVLGVLKGIGPFYKYIEKDDKKSYYHIEVLSLGTLKRSILEMVRVESIELDEVYEDPVDKKRFIFTLYLFGSPRVIDRLVNDIKSIASVQKVSYHTLKYGSRYTAEENVVEFLKEKDQGNSRS